MHKRISPSTIIATVALFFSLGGAGMAASRYLITSQSQISPRVLSHLQPHFRRIIGPPVSVDAGTMGSAIAVCPDGWRAVGGGPSGTVPVAESAPQTAGTSSFWGVEGTNTGPNPGVIQAYVVCESWG